MLNIAQFDEFNEIINLIYSIETYKDVQNIYNKIVNNERFHNDYSMK